MSPPAGTSEPDEGVAEVIGGQPWDDFRAALADDPSGVGDVLASGVAGGAANQDELAWAIQIESRWQPKSLNMASGAAGLIQFMPATQKALGMPRPAQQMTRSEQAPWIKKFFQGNPKPKVPGDTYLSIAYPAAIGKPDSFVIALPGEPIWTQNPAWRDPSAATSVTAGRIRQLGRPPSPAPIGMSYTNPPAKTGPGPVGMSFQGLLLLAAGGYLISQNRRRGGRRRR